MVEVYVLLRVSIAYLLVHIGLLIQAMDVKEVILGESAIRDLTSLPDGKKLKIIVKVLAIVVMDVSVLVP